MSENREQEYDRASKLTDEELISQGRAIYRQFDRKGDHFQAGVIQEIWLRMRAAQATAELLKRNEEL